MKIIVNAHKCEIVKTPVNEKEISVTKCEFEFADEITSEFVKEAYFTLNGVTYKQIIFNNECDIPYEVLQEKGMIEIGVVAYLVENEQEIKRYNPSPAYFDIWTGSLKDNAENSEPITPSEMEQFEQALQNGLSEVNDKLDEMDEALTEVDNLDIDAVKSGSIATVTITNKEGITKSVEIKDGEKGDKGDKGDTGATGPKGDKGDKGNTGDRGPQGIQGVKGDTGSQGPQGIAGENAKINGVNTLTIEAGTNITLDQEGNVLTINSTASGGTSDYTDLTNKPKINNVELVGNKSLNDLGIQPAGNYALGSDMTEAQNDIENLSIRVTTLENENQPVYGIRRKITNNSSPSWERILDSVGRFANATKDGENVQNDFDSLAPWSEIKSCNYDLTTKEINAWFGDPNFKFDGTNGDVFTYIPKTYWKIYQENDYDYVLLADYPKEGFTEINSFFVGRYDCTDIGGKLRTYSGLVPTTNRTVTAFRNSANALGSEFSQLDWRYFVLQMLCLVEYATYDSQTALGNGIMSRNLVNTLIAENSTNRVVVPSNTNFYIGQIIRIGTSANGGQIGIDRKITAVEEYDDGTITGYSVTFAGTPVNIAVGNYVSTCAQQTGQCDSLGMKSGCLNNDGYHSVIYRGMENIYGDVFMFVDGINIKDSQVYICKDHSQYQTDLFELPYKPLSYINYSTANGWAKTLGFDINEPFFRFPTEVGGSSSTYLCDYYVKGTGSVNFRIGGCSSDGQKNGFWSFYTSGSTAGASWDRACRILIDS